MWRSSSLTLLLLLRECQFIQGSKSQIKIEHQDYSKYLIVGVIMKNIPAQAIHANTMSLSGMNDES